MNTQVTKLLGLFAAMSMMAGGAFADVINYQVQMTLSALGIDPSGLNGALLDIKANVSSTAVYITSFGDPAVVMNNDATLTISGAPSATNNGTYALPQLEFFPTLAQAELLAAGELIPLTLPGGAVLTVQVYTSTTPTGSAEQAGNTVNILDFAPATLEFGDCGAQVEGDFGGAIPTYSEVGATITVSEQSSVPEPAGRGLMLIAIGVILIASRKINRAQS